VANPNAKPPKEHQWKPGQSGNPKGGKRGPHLTTLLREALSQPDEDYGTKAEKLIAVAMKYAQKGDFRFFKEIMERIEGKVPDQTDITTQGQRIVFNLVEAKRDDSDGE